MALFVFESISTPQMMHLPPLNAKLFVTGASTESTISFVVPSIMSTVGELQLVTRTWLVAGFAAVAVGM